MHHAVAGKSFKHRLNFFIRRFNTLELRHKICLFVVAFIVLATLLTAFIVTTARWYLDHQRNARNKRLSHMRSDTTSLFDREKRRKEQAQNLCPLRDEFEKHSFVPYSEHVAAILARATERHRIESAAGDTDELAKKTPDLEKVAYVTFVSNDAYVLPAAVMMHSIARTGSRHLRAICVNKDHKFSPESRAILSLFAQVIEIETLRSPFFIDIPRYVDTLTKLRLWQLDMFSKIVYLDVDVAIKKNIDDLFEVPAWAVAMDGDVPGRLSSGMMVIQPSLEMFDQMRHRLSRGADISMVFPDLNFLQTFFKEKAHLNSNNNNQKSKNSDDDDDDLGRDIASAIADEQRTAPATINKFPRWYQVYQDEFSANNPPSYLTQGRTPLTTFDPRVRGIHYPGADKPWGAGDLDSQQRKLGRVPVLCCLAAGTGSQTSLVSERQCEAALKKLKPGDVDVLHQEMSGLSVEGVRHFFSGEDESITLLHNIAQREEEVALPSAGELARGAHFVWHGVAALMMSSMRNFVRENKLIVAVVGDKNNTTKKMTNTEREFRALARAIASFTTATKSTKPAASNLPAPGTWAATEFAKLTQPLVSIFPGDDTISCKGRGFPRLGSSGECYCEIGFTGAHCEVRESDEKSLRVTVVAPRAVVEQFGLSHALATRHRTALLPKVRAALELSRGQVVVAALRYRMFVSSGGGGGDHAVTMSETVPKDASSAASSSSPSSDLTKLSPRDAGLEIDLIAQSHTIAKRIRERLTPSLLTRILADDANAAWINLAPGFEFCRFPPDEPNNADEENFLRLVLIPEKHWLKKQEKGGRSKNNLSFALPLDVQDKMMIRGETLALLEDETPSGDDYSADDAEVDGFHFRNQNLPIFIDPPVEPFFMDYKPESTAQLTVCEIVCARKVDQRKAAQAAEEMDMLTGRKRFKATKARGPGEQQQQHPEDEDAMNNNHNKEDDDPAAAAAADGNTNVVVHQLNSTFVIFDHEQRNWPEARAACESLIDLQQPSSSSSASAFTCGGGKLEERDGGYFLYSRLPRLTTQQDAKRMSELMMSAPVTVWGAYLTAWTGATDDGSEGNFRWVPENEHFCSVGSMWVP